MQGKAQYLAIVELQRGDGIVEGLPVGAVKEPVRDCWTYEEQAGAVAVIGEVGGEVGEEKFDDLIVQVVRAFQELHIRAPQQYVAIAQHLLVALHHEFRGHPRSTPENFMKDLRILLRI